MLRIDPATWPELALPLGRNAQASSGWPKRTNVVAVGELLYGARHSSNPAANLDRVAAFVAAIVVLPAFRAESRAPSSEPQAPDHRADRPALVPSSRSTAARKASGSVATSSPSAAAPARPAPKPRASRLPCTGSSTPTSEPSFTPGSLDNLGDDPSLALQLRLESLDLPRLRLPFFAIRPDSASRIPSFACRSHG
jgi:hypothetical protein